MIGGDLFKLNLGDKKKYIYLGASFVAVAVVFYLTGRYTAPESVKIVEKVVTKEIHHESTIIQQKTDYEALLKKFEEYSKVQDKVRIVVVKPDGTRTETETTHTNTNRNTATDTTQRLAQTTDTKVWKETVRVEERIKTVEVLKLAPPWRASAQVGYGVPSLWGNNAPSFIPGLPNGVVVGVVLERKIFGPVSAGAWVNSRLDSGVQLTLSF